MKIEVAKADLESALSVVGLVTTSDKDLSGHYLFRVKDEKVQVLASAKRLFAYSPLVAQTDGKEGEAFTVEAWRLDKWLAGVGDNVLKLEATGAGEVQASGPRSKVRFRSLDPSNFPYWDQLLDKAETVGSIAPEHLSRAFGVSKWFVSADDTQKPEFCQIEAVDGVMWATDRRALSSVEIPALPKLNIRIPGKDISSVVRFLTDKLTEGPIEIRTSERAEADGGGANCMFQRPDGCYLGVTRPSHAFPTLSVDRNADAEVSMTLDCEEFSQAISILSASAPKGQEQVTFRYDPKTEVLSLSMPCEAGGADEYPLELAKVVGGEKFDTSFTVDYPYIKGIGTTFGLDTLDFGIVAKGRGGFIAFKHEEGDGEGNRYFSVIVWRT